MRRNPERIAWIVLLSSFAIFCAVAVSIPLSIHWYLTTATDSQAATLEVISGTVLLEGGANRVPIGVTGTRGTIIEGSLIRTDSSSRAIITLFDHSTVTIFPDTQVALVEMRSPRFDWNPSGNVFVLQHITGRIRLGVARPLSKPSQFEVRSPHGAIQMGEGSYSIRVANDRTEIAVRNGQAVVQGSGESVSLKQGQRTIVSMGQPPAKAMSAARNLIFNGDFQEPLSHGWQIWLDQGGDGGTIDGKVDVVTLSDRNAIHIIRTGSGGNSAITGIVQKINEDVSDALSLALRFDVHLINQSLSGGGYQSSEYPLLVRLKYRDAYGSEAEWVRGFYYQNDANNPTQNGEQIPHDVWNPKEYDDLLELDHKPFYITSIEIYASGWDYDSMVSAVELIVQ
jgi:hypothetical protein